jgi:prepilin-type N-terminal cleavage/methylation domain-containing protein
MKSQRGFSLIELMLAAAAAGVIMMAAGALVVRASGWHNELAAKLEMNRHAREVYQVLAYGGQASMAGDDGTRNLYAIRGREDAPGSGMRNQYAFRYSSNDLTLTPDRSATMTVTCTAVDTPVPGCGSSGTRTVTGWMAEDIEVDDDYEIANATVEVEMTVMSPYQVQRAEAAGAFQDNYRFIFTLNRMEDDP